MPRLELVLTSNLKELDNLEDIANHLTETFSACPTVDPAAVKLYITLPQHYQTGVGATPGFIHLTISLLTGRDQKTRKLIGQTMADKLNELFRESLQTKAGAITVEVHEMETETFTKIKPES